MTKRKNFKSTFRVEMDSHDVPNHDFTVCTYRVTHSTSINQPVTALHGVDPCHRAALTKRDKKAISDLLERDLPSSAWEDIERIRGEYKVRLARWLAIEKTVSAPSKRCKALKSEMEAITDAAENFKSAILSLSSLAVDLLAPHHLIQPKDANAAKAGPEERMPEELYGTSQFQLKDTTDRPHVVSALGLLKTALDASTLIAHLAGQHSNIDPSALPKRDQIKDEVLRVDKTCSELLDLWISPAIGGTPGEATLRQFVDRCMQSVDREFNSERVLRRIAPEFRETLIDLGWNSHQEPD